MSDTSKNPTAEEYTGANELPDPAAFAAPEGYQKRKRKKRALEEPGGLSMNSLMDIMTIILVFLIKSYSNNPVQIKQSDDLKAPFSSAIIDPSESTAVTLTRNHILLDDEQVLSLEEGKVSEGDRTGFMIDPLFQRLQEAVDHQKKIAKFNSKSKFEGLITIISDRHVPFEVLSQAMYTAGQAQFSKFKFAVVKGGS